MSYQVTGQSLIDQARQRADEEASLFVTDANVLTMVNTAYRELYDLYGKDFVLTGSFSYATTGTLDLPSTFDMLVSLDANDGGFTATTGWRRLRQFMPAERNDEGDALRPMYRIEDNYINLVPRPPSTLAFRMLYVPQALALTASSDSITCFRGWEEYIVLDVASKMCLKGERMDQASYLRNERDACRSRIEAAIPRDAQEPQRIQDVRGWPWSIGGWRW